MGSLTGHGGYKLSKYRKFDGKKYKKAGLCTTKEMVEEFKKRLKITRGYKVRITKRSGAPYQYKYTVWVRI